MFPEQRKMRLVMIEAVFVPALFVMAIRAFFSQTSMMGIVLFVTTDTLLGRFAIFRFPPVAAGALGLGVRAFQFEIGLGMIECFLVQNNDLLPSPFVIRVAAPAFPLLDTLDVPMEAGMRFDILVYLLMAIQAKLALNRLTERLMAFIALHFVFCVSGNDLARHHQRFQRPGLQARGNSQQRHKDNSNQQTGNQKKTPIEHGAH